jgi:hypothetical protein
LLAVSKPLVWEELFLESASHRPTWKVSQAARGQFHLSVDAKPFFCS